MRSRKLFHPLLWIIILSPFSAAQRSRLIIVTENTPSPGANATSYSLCSTNDIALFTASILDESNACMSVKPTSILASTNLPNDMERRGLCSCDRLILKIQKIKIPRCAIFRNGQEMSYAQLVEDAFALCDLRIGNGTSDVSNQPTDPASSPMTTATGKTQSGSNIGLVVGCIFGVVAVAAIVVYVMNRRRRSAKQSHTEQGDFENVTHDKMNSPTDSSYSNYRSVAATETASAYPVATGKAATTHASSSRRTATVTGVIRDSSTACDTRRLSQLSLSEDATLVAVRIEYDTVFFGPLISRGGYGEVYKGTYRGEPVAIKQLLPDRRKDLDQIESFLGEIKLMASLEHERIVQFVGVAWNSPSDTCAIVEYMEGGDLRTVLTRWDVDDARPQGFDADKIKIALHVAHALTYLHSLQPVVLHRDLKSKNILLNADLDAKLTDFGVSRERADSTMTGGVGTSLWMAPEVMLGEHYDEKADIFSFGIVLSELDTQRLPYADAKATDTDHKLPDTAILQLVTLGHLEISFSATAHTELVRLGRDCVRLDPTQRPTAAEALHRIHEVLRTSF